jgi:hypothetical protein
MPGVLGNINLSAKLYTRSTDRNNDLCSIHTTIKECILKKIRLPSVPITALSYQNRYFTEKERMNIIYTCLKRCDSVLRLQLNIDLFTIKSLR